MSPFGGAASRSSPAPLGLEAATSLEAVRPEWDRLARASGNVFSTWEWASTWWRERGADRELLLTVCRAEKDAVAVLPLYVWSRRGVRVARFLGHGPADQLGPVCSPEDRRRVAAVLPEARRRANAALLLAELLPGGSDWSEALGGTLLRRESSPTLALDGGWDGYLAARSANFRQQIRRRERALGRRYDLRFRLADPHRLQDELTLLVSLHAARWGPGSPFLAWERFHREFAQVALERGWLRLWFLELDGRAAAAWYGFRFAGVESYYQAGRDPSFERDSVGFVLLAHSIRAAAEEGMREYRFLRGAEPFKLRFADADPGLETCALADGVRGRAVQLAARGGLSSASLRSLLRRLTGAHRG